MKVLIKQATIVSPNSPLNGSKKDIFIKNGIIESIADNISENADKTLDEDGLHISIGWMDIFAHFCDPGFEYRETIESGANAAASGGFTDIMVLPNTNPAVHTKSQVEYIIQKAASTPVNIHPLGAVTKNTDSNELAEMYDMRQSGAIAFSNGNNSIQSTGILLKALQYILPFNGTIIQVPDDKSVNPQGLMNEGIISTQLGLPGKPAFAEEIMIARDIELLKYTGSKIHITGVSTKKGIALIAEAKKLGLNITCSVTPYHLYFCDEDLVSYDTSLKVNPPLRTKEDRAALQEALLNGTIDCIASHHNPQNYDNKICEFEYAKNGMETLESLFGAIGHLLNKDWNIDALINILTTSPRKIFGLEIPKIKEGEKAVITLFNPKSEYTFSKANIRSKSNNNAFIGRSLKGKVIGIINGNKTYFN